MYDINNITGIPAPSLEWWREDDQGEKLMLHTDSYARSLLHFGPLQRHHHNNKLSCEAKNNDQVQPVRRQISINMICKFHHRQLFVYFSYVVYVYVCHFEL